MYVFAASVLSLDPCYPMTQQSGYMVHEFSFEDPFTEAECQIAEAERWPKPFREWNGRVTFWARQ